MSEMLRCLKYKDLSSGIECVLLGDSNLLEYIRRERHTPYMVTNVIFVVIGRGALNADEFEEESFDCYTL